MRIAFIASALLSSLMLDGSYAFVPIQMRQSSSALHARYTPPAPPVPPPPPPKETDVFENLFQKLTENAGGSSTDGADLGSFVSGLFADLSAKLEKGVSLPSLPSLPNSLPSFDSLQDLRRQFEALDQSVVVKVEEIARQLQDLVVKEYPVLAPYLDKLKTWLAPALNSPSLTLVVSALLTYTIVSSVLSWDRAPPPSQPYPAGKYDPIAARAYFDNKLHLVLGRGLEILVQSLQFGLRLLQDKIK